MADLSIQNAFLDGLEEIFTIMFTDRLNFYMLDKDNTVIDIYGESTKKKYLEPIKLIGRIQINRVSDENPDLSTDTTATITIPTKQLISNSIPRITSDDLEILKTAKFEYDGEMYLVDEVTPKTLVADMWQIYDFRCSLDKKTLRK